MTLTKLNSLKPPLSFVKTELKHAEGGHDWFHIERVYKNTLLIAKQEDVDITSRFFSRITS